MLFAGFFKPIVLAVKPIALTAATKPWSRSVSRCW